MTKPDPRLVNVICGTLNEALAETPVLKLSARHLAYQVADDVWTWLAEGDELNPTGPRADQRSGHG